MHHLIATDPPADGGYPVDSDLHQMSDDGGPVGPDPARWADDDRRDKLGEKDTVTGELPAAVGLRTTVVLSPAVEARIEAEIARAKEISRASGRHGRTAGGISWGPGTPRAE